MFNRWLSDDFTLSKRHLGVLMIVVGVMLAWGMLALELVSSSVPGLGAMQWMGIVGGGGSVVIGVTLLPLGDQAA